MEPLTASPSALRLVVGRPRPIAVKGGTPPYTARSLKPAMTTPTSWTIPEGGGKFKVVGLKTGIGSIAILDAANTEIHVTLAISKKAKKRTPMPAITPRDADIFRILSSGVHTSVQIRHELKKFVAKNPKAADDKGDGYDRKMSEKALSVRLSILMEADYIASKLYPANGGTGVEAGYVLSTEGKTYLTEDLHYDEKHIRDALPKKEHRSHEFQLVSVVDTIKREGNTLGYTYDMEDENYLKKITKGAQKKVPYPDLHVMTEFRIGNTLVSRNLAIEIDNGSTKPRLVAEKAHNLYAQKKWLTVFLCTASTRINKLRAAFAEYTEERKAQANDPMMKDEIDKMYGRVFYGITYEFLTKGLLNTTWTMVKGGAAVLIPTAYTAKKK